MSASASGSTHATGSIPLVLVHPAHTVVPGGDNTALAQAGGRYGPHAGKRNVDDHAPVPRALRNLAAVAGVVVAQPAVGGGHNQDG